jgi:predicted hydrocarbon binding protein/KaiC/GvpD/RAD55 family RecA-like ATPase
MEKRGVSLAEIQDVPRGNLILLAGPAGAGKSTFCYQTVLNGIAAEKPVILITTEQSASSATGFLREKGLGEITPGALSFVDAFTETVGLACTPRSDTVCANCADLNSLSMATTKLQERMGQKGILLAFDSLTSPYLFCGTEITKFIRLFLTKFAAEGNSVLALVDEGCGKEEDLGAMMSVANGIIRMEIKENSRVINVVKHPKLTPTKVEVPVTVRPRAICSCFDTEYVRREAEMSALGIKVTLRSKVGDYVNIAWRNLIFWSGMLWEPKRFPMIMYELTKYSEDPTNYNFDMVSLFPWHKKILMKLFFPKSLSRVKDMKKIIERFWKPSFTQWRMATLEYLDGISKMDEHYFKLHEGYECWGFDNVGTPVGIMKAAMMAGTFQGMEEILGGPSRDWNVVETKCIGLGDPYCEWKAVPRKIDELRNSLEKDSDVIDKVQEKLMNHILGFLLQGKPLMERPTLGSGVHIHEVQHVTAAPTVDERLQMVFRMGGARAGKMLGERLTEAGIKGDEAINRVIDFMNYCKVGKVTVNKTIKIEENCERFAMKTAQPSCYFTTGLLNGLFSAVKDKHVREIKCIAAGEPHCEWEII